MTVANLWDLCDNWDIYSTVCIYVFGVGVNAEYHYYREALKDYGDRRVHRFSYDERNDTMTIDIERRS